MPQLTCTLPGHVFWQVHMPTSLPSDAELASVHCPDYLAAFSSGTLDTARMRRIGFGEATRSQELIRRTKVLGMFVHIHAYDNVQGVQ